MKKVFLGVLLGAALYAVPTAQASCGLNCLNRKVNKLQHAVNVDTRALAAIATCFSEAPVTRYGDPAGTFGYSYSDGVDPSFNTTALDGTQSGDTVGVWMVYDRCNTSPARRMTRAVGQVADGLSSLLGGSPRSTGGLLSLGGIPTVARRER